MSKRSHWCRGMDKYRRERDGMASMRDAEIKVNAEMVAEIARLKAEVTDLSERLANDDHQIKMLVEEAAKWRGRASVYEVERDRWRAEALAARACFDVLGGPEQPDAISDEAWEQYLAARARNGEVE